MKEYQKIIEYYSQENLGWFSKLTPYMEWGNRLIGETYLNKYWLSQSNYESQWREIQNKIFVNQDIGLPALVFSQQFKLSILNGGCLFVKEDFENLQKCMRVIGDSHFVVIENTFGNKLQEPAFKFFFPANISWEELTNGNFVSSTFIESMYKEYFVFGTSGKWGKYSANDYEHPLDIIGFKPEYAPIFKEHFKQSKEEQEEINKWIPEEYKALIK